MPQTMRFNPAFLSDEESVSNFAARKREFDNIVKALEPGGGAPRVLIVAPRGAGKTTLCRRVLAEVRQAPLLSHQWHPIFLSEESYTVTTAGEFLLECLFQLNDQSPSRSIEEDLQYAQAASSEDELIKRALNGLKSAAKENSRRLLIIVENFHMILNDQVGKKGDELLDILNDESLFGVLATTVPQTDSENSRLPIDYKTITLRPLDLDECLALWSALTETDPKKERIRPLEILTGGSPRLLHILADFMKIPSLRDLMDKLNLLIDQNTEYFKSQIDGLPATERKVFAALLDLWDPSSSKEVAEAARVTPNVASVMLNRLTDRGTVTREIRHTKSVFYQATERLFNIYYLMRRRNHPSSRVKALVSFMTSYYERDELVLTTASIVKEACALDPDLRAEHHSTFGAIIASATPDLRARILAETPAEFISSFRADAKSRRALLPGDGIGAEEPNSTESEIEVIISKVEHAADEKQYELSFELLLEGIQKYPDNGELRVRLALLYWMDDNFDEALPAAHEAVRVAADDPWAHTSLGLAFEAQKNYSDARLALERALEIDPKAPVALNSLAGLLMAEGKKDEAINLFERAYESALLVDDTAARFGRLLYSAGKPERAEQVLREITTENVDYFETRRAFADMLHNVQRSSEGLDILKAAATELNTARAWMDVGTFAARRNETLPEAKQAILKSIELGNNKPLATYRLATVKRRLKENSAEISEMAESLLANSPDDPSAATVAGRIFFDLSAFDEAERAFRHALNISPEDDRIKFRLAKTLLRRATALPKVEQMLREIISAKSQDVSCEVYKELSELLIHSGRDDEALLIASEAIEKNNACFCCLVLAGQVLTREDDNEGARAQFEKALSLNPKGAKALTGLARVVEPEYASKLIGQALEYHPKNPESYLTRAKIDAATTELKIKYASQALELNPQYLEAHLFIAPLLSTRGRLEEALSHIQSTLCELENNRELIPEFVEATMKLAQQGHGQKLSDLIAASDARKVIEPLDVALKLSNGELPLVAAAVLEVAKDIVSRYG